MHSGNLSELGGASLTETEREALLDVMQRAKDFDEKMQRATNTKLEGTLSKWTNALKGWQSRWLCVDQQQGVLHYYTSEDRKKAPPRGSLHLWGAVIAPSDEDSQTFIVNGANGEAYKLRAGDAKERQYWVSRLRSEIERCTTSAQSSYSTNTTSSTSTNTQVPSTSAQSNTTHTASNTIPSSPLSPLTSPTSSSTDKTLSQTTPTRRVSRSKGRGLSAFTARASKKQRKQHSRRSEQGTDQEDGLPGGEAMLELLTRLMEYQSSLTSQLESCGGVGVSPVDEEVLLLKATSEAAVHSVKDCLALIQLQQQTCSSSTTNVTSLNTAPTSTSLAEEEESKVSVDDAGPPPTTGSTSESAEEGSRHTPSSPSHSVTVTTV